MPVDHSTSVQPPVSRPLAGVGGRCASWAPETTDSVRWAWPPIACTTAGRCSSFRTLGLSDAPTHATSRPAIDHVRAKKFIDIPFAGRSFDGFMTRAAASDALLWLADEVTQSAPAEAAFSQRCLGFADQLGGSFGHHSRRADHCVERTARRRAHRRTDATATGTAVRGR